MLTACESSMPRLHGAGCDSYSIRHQQHVSADDLADTASPQTTEQVSDLSWLSLRCRTWDRQTDRQTDGQIAILLIALLP